MARADGNASAAEFATFERLFKVPDRERANAARFYRLAQGSTAGFEAYASQAAALLGPGTPVLEDLLEALLLIAVTDGVHPAELDYLRVVAERLGFDAAAYARIRARYIAPAATTRSWSSASPPAPRPTRSARPTARWSRPIIPTATWRPARRRSSSASPRRGWRRSTPPMPRSRTPGGDAGDRPASPNFNARLLPVSR